MTLDGIPGSGSNFRQCRKMSGRIRDSQIMSLMQGAVERGGVAGYMQSEQQTHPIRGVPLPHREVPHKKFDKRHIYACTVRSEQIHSPPRESAKRTSGFPPRAEHRMESPGKKTNYPEQRNRSPPSLRPHFGKRVFPQCQIRSEDRSPTPLRPEGKRTFPGMVFGASARRPASACTVSSGRPLSANGYVPVPACSDAHTDFQHATSMAASLTTHPRIGSSSSLLAGAQQDRRGSGFSLSSPVFPWKVKEYFGNSFDGHGQLKDFNAKAHGGQFSSSLVHLNE